MKFLPLIPIALSSLALADDGVATATLHFLSGDSLSGNPGMMDRDQVAWKSPMLEKPATFHAERVREIRMPTRIYLPDSAAGHEATVKLTNGDELRGQLASFNNEEIHLDTWYAGQLSFRRVMVRELAIREMPAYLYRGPTANDAWIHGSSPSTWSFDPANQWSTESPGIIGLDVPLSDEVTLEFDVRWQDGLRMDFIVFSDLPEADRPQKGYEVVFQNRSISLRRAGTRNLIGHTNRAMELQQNERARIRLHASKKSGTFVLYINDRMIEQWKDADFDPVDLGTAMHFISTANSPLSISRIDVSRWNGVIDESTRPRQGMPGGMAMPNWGLQFDEEMAEATPPKPEDGGMTLRNGDRIRGTVKSITDGKIILETAFRDVTLPIERLRSIDLKTADFEEPKRERGDVRASFADGGSMVFRLDGVSQDGAKIQTYSQTFGHAEFDLTAFNRIEFNIYDLVGLQVIRP